MSTIFVIIHAVLGPIAHCNVSTTDVCLTADPGVASLIPARSYTFMEIDHKKILQSFSSLPLNHSRRVSDLVYNLKRIVGSYNFSA